MATSGYMTTTAYKGTNGDRYLELTWQRESIDVAAQTSTIKWTLTSRGTYTGYFMSGAFYVAINGVVCYNVAARIKLYPNQQIATGRITIQHNTDGTKTFSAYVSAGIYYSSPNVSGSANFTLDMVGMATITRAVNFYDTSNPTIEYKNPVGNAITSLQAAISLTGENPDIAYRNIPINGTSYTFYLTEAERNILRAATVGSSVRKVRFYLRNVVNGEILFDWKEVYFTVMDGNPIVEGSVVDINVSTIALTGDNTKLIKHHSTAYATMTSTPVKSAQILTETIEHGGKTHSGNTATIENISSSQFTLIATDNRKLTTRKTITATMIEYIKPSVNIDSRGQMATEGVYELQCSGNYFNGSFGAAANTLSVMYRYKEQDGEYGEWFAMSASPGEGTYTANASVSGLDYRTVYVFQCKITDALNTVLSTELTVRSLPVFHWGENDFVFEVPVKFNKGAEGIEGGSTGGGECAIQNGVLDGDLNIKGDLRLKGDGNYGNALYFGDGEYACIKEETDDELTITAPTLNLLGDVYINGSSLTGIKSGTWTPTLTETAAVNSYTVRQGWYMRAGDVITIGWQIKAVINSGYNGMPIQISTDNLTYKPAYSAFGGGVAHNIYILATGYNFEGWAINESGIITPRLQPADDVSFANLQISSSAFYPTGSNITMTLAGTICYQISAGVG